MKYLFGIMLIIVFGIFIWLCHQKYTEYRAMLFKYWENVFTKKEIIIITGLAVVSVILCYLGLRVWLG